MQKGDFEQAIRALSDAIALHPHHAMAFNARGYCYMMQRKYKEAIADFDEALRLRPGYENAIANRAAAVRAAGKK
jgi:Flp pilus assembly protein TadD